MALPYELQEQIMCDLPTRALKSVRLACAPLNRVAEGLLFRSLLLYPDTGSFEKLDHISTHTRLSHYVRSITYSGDLFHEDERSGDVAFTLAGWRSDMGSDSTIDNDYCVTLVQMSHAELEGHYSAYVAHVQGQIALRKGHQEVRWLKTIFERLPNLERLGYAVMEHEERMEIFDTDSLEGLAPFAQATLMGRTRWAGTARTAQQIMALLTAALATRIKVKTFEAKRVPWELFTPVPKQWHVLFEGAKYLVSLKLHLLDFDASEIENEDVVGTYFASFIGSARKLTTLELDLGGASEKVSPAGLHGVFEGCITAGGLKRLMLRSMSCHEATLRTIIVRNAETLRSLELGCIYLLNEETSGRESGPSWVSTIRFLQSTLKLNHVMLDGYLANGKNESWKTHPLEACPAETDTDSNLYHGENSLRSRIERYILHGGECPISGDNFSNWEREWVKDKKGDHSWYSCEWSELDDHERSITRR